MMRRRVIHSGRLLSEKKNIYIYIKFCRETILKITNVIYKKANRVHLHWYICNTCLASVAITVKHESHIPVWEVQTETRVNAWHTLLICVGCLDVRKRG